VVALTELGMSTAQLRRAWYGLESDDLETVARNLSRALDEWDAATPRAAIFSAPFDPYVRLVPVLRALDCKVVYYAMDDFAAAPALGYTQFVAGAEEYLTRHSDARCGVTPHVARALERFGGRAEVIPNAIDLAAWRADTPPRRAEAQRAGGELAVGYWGTLMESLFDAEPVAHAAEARPRWTFHLLGAVDPEPHRASVAARFKGLSNVVLHGAVEHADLPRYAAGFDAALAPFPDTAFTRGRDPLKVYEYLAAGLGVAATHTPQLAGFPSVFVAYSPAEFVTAIEQAAETRRDAHAREEFLARNTWDERATRLAALVMATDSPAARADAPAILPSFAQPAPPAVMRYARALEQELTGVQAWARELEQQAQARGALERVKRRILGRRDEGRSDGARD
jgi:glycosyltransferase involved in cell wall biosynthesis